MVRMAPSTSVDIADMSARLSWVWREILWSRRPSARIGRIRPGTRTMTAMASFGLVTNIRRERADELDCGAEDGRDHAADDAADGRDVAVEPGGQLADPVGIVERRVEPEQVVEDRFAQIGEDAFAEDRDVVGASGRRDRHHQGDADDDPAPIAYGGEVLGDEAGIDDLAAKNRQAEAGRALETASRTMVTVSRPR